jgi:hypothetical protein
MLLCTRPIAADDTSRKPGDSMMAAFRNAIVMSKMARLVDETPV